AIFVSEPRVSVTSSFDSAVFVDCWVVGQFDRFGRSGMRHAFDATYESYDDLSADQKSQSCSVAARAHETRKHSQVSRHRGRRRAAPLAAIEQQAGGVRRLGIRTAGVASRLTAPAFFGELRERGWVEGQNLVIDRRGGDGNSERVPALAAELVQMKRDVIVSF